MKNKKTILMAGGGILAIVVVGIVVWQMGAIRTFFGEATGGAKPQGVRVANISANSAAISWQTTEPVVGQVEYGTTPGSFYCGQQKHRQPLIIMLVSRRFCRKRFIIFVSE